MEFLLLYSQSAGLKVCHHSWLKFIYWYEKPNFTDKAHVLSSTGHVLSSQSRKEAVEKGLGSLSFKDYGIKCPPTLV